MTEKKVKYALTGEVKFGNKDNILDSGAVGSCIVVTAYDRNNMIGGMAHIMLPGASPEQEGEKTKYAQDALTVLFEKIDPLNTEVCVLGGANVLQREDDRICENIQQSVTELLNERKIAINKMSLGGTERRSVSFNIDDGSVYCSTGCEPQKLFFHPEMDQTTEA